MTARRSILILLVLLLSTVFSKGAFSSPLRISSTSSDSIDIDFSGFPRNFQSDPLRMDEESYGYDGKGLRRNIFLGSIKIGEVAIRASGIFFQFRFGAPWSQETVKAMAEAIESNLIDQSVFEVFDDVHVKLDEVSPLQFSFSISLVRKRDERPLSLSIQPLSNKNGIRIQFDAESDELALVRERILAAGLWEDILVYGLEIPVPEDESSWPARWAYWDQLGNNIVEILKNLPEAVAGQLNAIHNGAAEKARPASKYGSLAEGGAYLFFLPSSLIMEVGESLALAVRYQVVEQAKVAYQEGKKGNLEGYYRHGANVTTGVIELYLLRYTGKGLTVRSVSGAPVLALNNGGAWAAAAQTTVAGGGTLAGPPILVGSAADHQMYRNSHNRAQRNSERKQRLDDQKKSLRKKQRERETGKPQEPDGPKKPYQDISEVSLENLPKGVNRLDVEAAVKDMIHVRVPRPVIDLALEKFPEMLARKGREIRMIQELDPARMMKDLIEQPVSP